VSLLFRPLVVGNFPPALAWLEPQTAPTSLSAACAWSAHRGAECLEPALPEPLRACACDPFASAAGTLSTLVGRAPSV